MISPIMFRYISAGIGIAAAALGTGIGQSIAGVGEIDALSRQSFESDKGFRAMMIGLALTETGSILTLVVILMLLFSTHPHTLGNGLAELGISLAMGVSAGVIGYASSMIVKESCKSIARQPFFAQKILMFMLLVQSVVEAPVIFAFLISLMIRVKATDPISTHQGFMLMCAGLVSALSSIGSSIGQSFFAASALKSVGLNKKAYAKIFPFTLLNQAIIETPVIFSLLLSFAFIFRPPSTAMPVMSSLAGIAAVISLGVGSIPVGISTGRVAASACMRLANNPDNYGPLFRTALLAHGLIESSVIYSLIVAIVLISQF